MESIQNKVQSLQKYHRLTNYISTAQLYLKQNTLLNEKLDQSHIKDRILGHWGTVPGLNLIQGAFNILIKDYQKNDLSRFLMITGPGHGAPAYISGLWVEDSLETYYPQYARTLSGLENLIHDFSWPRKLQSHITPHLPGSITEGGELGYSLGIAYGTVMDNPTLTTLCVIGDGEAETGALAASWQVHKFINPLRDGIVIPLLHINGYKISGPTIFGTMSEDHLYHYFSGLGYEPIIVNQYSSTNIYEDILLSFFKAQKLIEKIKSEWQAHHTTPRFPVILLKTKKGWTGPEFLHEVKIEDSNPSHGIPLKKPKYDQHEFDLLKEWLESYHVNELIDIEGTPHNDILEIIPDVHHRLGRSPFVTHENEPLQIPDITLFDDESVTKGDYEQNGLKRVSLYLSEVVKLNPNRFRVFSPDESESNHLEHLFHTTSRCYTGAIREHDDHIDCEGKIIEILSEQTLQSIAQGYAMGGKSNMYVSYEAFLPIISSQIDQHLKYLSVCETISWRPDIPSMNYISTATLWRQEHNGFTHQNPSLIHSLVAKPYKNINLYFPIDINTLLVALDTSLKSVNGVNLITAGKTEFPQWTSLGEAQTMMERGVSIIDWVSDDNPDIILTSCGDYQHVEVMAARELLKKRLPELKLRIVNISFLTPIGIGSFSDSIELDSIFTPNKPVILNFHGYPATIKSILSQSNLIERFTVLGYQEKGGTTTPFDMQVLNNTSRYHMCKEVVTIALKNNYLTNSIGQRFINEVNEIINNHELFIIENGIDLPEVKHWNVSKQCISFNVKKEK